MVTTEMAVNLPIETRLGVISAQSAHGLNVIKDYFTGWSDKLGGRSSSIQNTLKEAQEEVIEELKREALALGGNAIVAIDFDISQYSGGGKSMLFVVATGTAVKLRRR
ncbi:heavy metal-binding domain-containing protein [Alteromonas sp. SM 2104]|nr:heavy metal-binding domain-containing protein [Alteromonas oceanisediminis]